MLLVVDVGNTQTVLGLYEGEDLVHDFRIESNQGRTLDENHVLLRSLLSVAEVERDEIEAAIIASVVPAMTETFTRAVSLAFGIEPLVVGPGIKTGMPILYENPREVGADRIVNAVAAYAIVGGAVIVVDFGTATTFDVVSEKGEYLGGVIAPGIRISADTLFTHAAKLPRVEVAKPPAWSGATRSTRCSRASCTATSASSMASSTASGPSSASSWPSSPPVASHAWSSRRATPSSASRRTSR